ncbi:MAG: DUF565 domain-containing protein [Prochlorococcaceae cyanobacterium]
MRSPLQAAPASPRPLQQTRFQRSLVEAGDRLVAWASNPWRRISLRLIVLLISFTIGGVVASIGGQIGQSDPIGALLCVLSLELAVRARGPLRRRGGDRLLLQLLDMARIGLLYGLLLDGFKLL